MQVGILGPLTVADGERPVEVGGSRLRALLIRLAAAGGGWVAVGELVDALWAGDPPRDEVNSLQSLVSRLRRVLPAAELVESGPAGYRLAVEPDGVDGVRFERLVADARRHLAGGGAATALPALDEALALWRGPALAEVTDAPYASAWAQRLATLRLDAIDLRGEARLRLGRPAEVVTDLQQVTVEHPLRERSHELLIRALARTGRQAEALATYERLRRRLADELGLDPPVHLQALQAAVLRDDPALLPRPDRADGAAGGRADRAVGAHGRRTNLRARLTSFVGREDDLAHLIELLEGARLVTLVGTGGAGKTRLAGEAAGRLRTRGTDGVWMVELAPVTDPADVASAVLGSLGAVDRAPVPGRPVVGARDAQTRLVESLFEHDVVLVLDNCEHVVDAAARLAEHLLGECPRLTVLATSREPLGIVGETLWPVAPLALPPAADVGAVGADPRADGGADGGAGADAALAAAGTSPAVRLFLDRAALVRPGFRLSGSNLPAVVEICRRLDGLPLAIELAAARLRTLSVDAVAARLGDRFRLLTGGNRTAMPRHQTLRAVVAWSWELLTDEERTLAARLSVLPGGATAASAGEVCGRSLPADAVADLLITLADKSLLVVVDGSARDAAEPRYRMLETIREFAAEQLLERGEGTGLRAAHSRFFLRLAETAEPRLRTADQITWLDRLTAERDNLLAALRYAAEAGDADTATRLGAALSWYWTLLGRHDEAAAWLGQALAVPGERPPEPYAIASVVRTFSAAASGLGLPDDDLVDELLETVTALDVTAAHPLLALVEPGIELLRDRTGPARRAMARNLTHPDPWARAMLHLMAGVLAENEGDAATMRAELPLAIGGFRRLGDRWGTGTAIGALASVRAADGDLDGAIADLEDSRRMMAELHASDDEAYAVLRIGMLRVRQGDLAGARRDVERAVRVAERTGSAAAESASTFALAELAHREGRPDEARRLADRALDLVERAPFAPGQVKAVIHSGLAGFEVAEGRLDRAAEHLARARAGAVETRDMPVAALVATAAADLALARGDARLAAGLLGAGVRLRGLDDLTDPDLRRVGAAVEAALGPAEYQRAHGAGRELSRDDALALTATGLPEVAGQS